MNSPRVLLLFFCSLLIFSSCNPDNRVNTDPYRHIDGLWYLDRKVITQYENGHLVSEENRYLPHGVTQSLDFFSYDYVALETVGANFVEVDTVPYRRNGDFLYIDDEEFLIEDISSLNFDISYIDEYRILGVDYRDVETLLLVR